MLRGPLEYLEHSPKVHKKFSIDIWKKSFRWKMSVLASLKIGLGFLAKTLIFHLKHFFQMSQENFLCALWLSSRYLKASPNIVLYASKKIRTIRHVKENILKEKYKKPGFWKIESQNRVETSCQNTHFSLETFFSNAPRKFSIHSMTMFKVFKRSA